MPGPSATQALFVGAGREELLRVSNIAVSLLHLTRTLVRKVQGVHSPDVDAVREIASRRLAHGAFGGLDAYGLHSYLDKRVAQQWAKRVFAYHEGRGLIHTAQALTGLR